MEPGKDRTCSLGSLQWWGRNGGVCLCEYLAHMCASALWLCIQCGDCGGGRGTCWWCVGWNLHSANYCPLVLGKSSHSLNLSFLTSKTGLRLRWENTGQWTFKTGKQFHYLRNWIPLLPCCWHWHTCAQEGPNGPKGCVCWYAVNVMPPCRHLGRKPGEFFP